MACSTSVRTIKMGIDYSDVHILCTKKIDTNLLEGLEQKGIYVDNIPFTDIVPLVNNYLSNKIYELSQQKITAIFTSANGVKAVANLLNKTEINWEIACLDKGTYYAVQEHFPHNKVVLTAKDGDSLAQLLVQHNYSDAPAVFFCGNKRLDTLPFYFSSHNIALEEVMVYQTLIKSQPLEKYYNGIMFFSPSAVDSYFVYNEFPNNCVAFCIGETTANALTKKLSQPAIVVQAAEHTAASLLESVIIYYNR